MVQLNGLKVELRINGQPAVEYEDPDAEDGSLQDEVSRYIEAHDGGSFTFRCTVPASYVVSTSNDALSFNLHLDGTWRRSLINEPSPIKKTIIEIDGGYYKTSTGPSLRVFKFGNLHIHGGTSLRYAGHTTDEVIGRETDPAAISEQMQDLRSIGLARIEVWRERERQGCKPKSKHPGRNAEESHGLEVHERAAKARVSEGVLMGAESVLSQTSVTLRLTLI